MTPAKLAEVVSGGHSPGPWRVCGSDRGKCQCGQVWSVAQDLPVATVFIKDDDVGFLPEEMWHANADLIARAPELLKERDAMAAENGRLRDELAAAKERILPAEEWAGEATGDSLVDRLRGIYDIHGFIRRFGASPIDLAAADAITTARSQNARLVALLREESAGQECSRMGGAGECGWNVPGLEPIPPCWACQRRALLAEIKAGA